MSDVDVEIICRRDDGSCGMLRSFSEGLKEVILYSPPRDVGNSSH
jgi:hypothetical protein